MKTKSDEYYMKLALKAARTSIKEGQSPFGAVIVDTDGRVVVACHNRVMGDRDPTAHAEIVAIREACKLRGDISGYTIYCSCEPCPMCMSAIHWAKISRVVYAAGIADAHVAGFNEILFGCRQMNKYISPTLKLDRIMAFEGTKILRQYKGSTY